MDSDRLRSIPLFSELADDDLKAVATYAAEISVGAGKHLVDEGDYSYALFAIEEGEAEVTRDGEQLNTLGPGDVFGEMGVLEKGLRNATVVAKTPMRLVTLSDWDVRRMRKQLGPVLERLQQKIEERRPA